jgi:hypothetical protein
MKLLSKLIWAIWLVTLLVNLNPVLACMATGMPAFPIADDRQRQLGITYDEQNPAENVYDVGVLADSSYDSAAVPIANDKQNRTVRASRFFARFAKFLAAEGGTIAWNPLNGPGPLGADMAATFRGGSYSETVLGEDTTLYRAYGGNSQQIGPFWTQTPPSGPLQSTIDSALNPAWGNTAQNVATIRVPSGTTIYTGFAAPQGGLVGGGSQVVIPTVNPAWLVK